MRRIPSLILLAALPFLIAGPAMAQGNGVSTSSAALPGVIRLQSAVEGLRIVPLQRLPRAPASAAAPTRQSCGHLLNTPGTPAGREVERAGWGVTGEVRLGPYQAVSFVGSFGQGTSGSCLLGEGNIGIFRGTDLAAIVYVPAGGTRPIGRAIAFEQDGLRIWDGDYLSQPMADLRLGQDGGLTIQPLAAEERVCNGTASVPNIFGRPINEARAMLARSGWSPAVPRREAGEDRDMRVADLVQRGVTEVEACSGTGFAFCSYNYRGTAGTLNVATVGDNDFPSVSGYEVQCGARN